MKEVVLLCALAAPALAVADEVGHWYVNPNVGAIRADRDRGTDRDAMLYGLGIGKHINQGLSVELNLNGTRLDGKNGVSNLSLWGGTLDFLGVLNRDGRVSPYITGGFGAAKDDHSPGDNSTNFLTQAGLGLMIRAWESSDGARSFTLRPEVKARWDDVGREGHMVDYIGTLGFVYGFGAPKAAPVEAAPPPPPPPPPAPPPAPPADTDGDGVIDTLDKCPGTPAGVSVDAYGCPLKGSITLEGVNFEFNSAKLTAESDAVLSPVAKDLQKHKRLKIELQGHTDSVGNDAYNLKLSQQRADSVRDYLVGQGVDSSQLSAKGYGEAQPVESNKTKEGRAKNRRVVMSVLENPGDVKVENAAQ